MYALSGRHIYNGEMGLRMDELLGVYLCLNRLGGRLGKHLFIFWKPLGGKNRFPGVGSIERMNVPARQNIVPLLPREHVQRTVLLPNCDQGLRPKGIPLRCHQLQKQKNHPQRPYSDTLFPMPFTSRNK